MKNLKNYEDVCIIKGVKKTQAGEKAYNTALASIYHAICLDIDNTVTYNNTDEKLALVKCLSKLAKRNIIICFITGRGRENALEYLSDLKKSIIVHDRSIDEKQFCRWYCITNNGAMLYSYNLMTDQGFMAKSISLIDHDIREEYLKLKDDLQKSVIELLSSRLDIRPEILKQASDKSIGDNSCRFPIDPIYDERVDDKLVSSIRQIVAAKTKHNFGVSRGYYHKGNKTVIEISMTTKGEAIDMFESYVGIPKNKMVRIGDQGDYSGNDYEMLKHLCGFSVERASSDELYCWPILSNTKGKVPNILKTVTLLNSLKITPTICLEKPNEVLYKPRLAHSEKRSMAENRQTYEYYQNHLLYTFYANNTQQFKVSDYIEPCTGGFYIHDYEYELLKASQPSHILFTLYDNWCYNSKKTHKCLKFALRTDTGLLLRGPLNYYNGLSFRNFETKDVSNGLIRLFNFNRSHFFKKCVNCLNYQKHTNLKDSISRRVLLGILDSIRDYLLININIHLQVEISKTANCDNLIIINKKKKKLQELYSLAQRTISYMYSCLFGGIDSNFYNTLRNFIKKDILEECKSLNILLDELISKTEFNYGKAYRAWREIDSFYENIIAIDTSIRKVLNECELGNKEIICTGIRYGSLELPIISAMLLDIKYGHYARKYKIATLCLNSNYEENHTTPLETKRNLCIDKSFESGSNYYHLLMDDNLLTGRTLQLGINMLVGRCIYPEKIFVVRYPTINRIKHMFMPNHGAPDPDLFWNFVYGLTSPTPYTRNSGVLDNTQNETSLYLDELGEFNTVRSFVLALLYKNGLYSEKSEASIKFKTK